MVKCTNAAEQILISKIDVYLFNIEETYVVINIEKNEARPPNIPSILYLLIFPLFSGLKSLLT